jgi:hypothetical protein
MTNPATDCGKASLNSSAQITKDGDLHSSWAPCPPGTLSKEGAKRIRHRRMRRGLGVAVVAIAITTPLIPMADTDSNASGSKDASVSNVAVSNLAVSNVAGDGSGKNNPSNQPNYGGIVCSRVRQQVADYRSGKLDTETRSKMESHVKQCVLCRHLLVQKSDAASITHLIAMDQSLAGWDQSF